MMSHQAERYHSLDFLRGLMMFLGILLHGMLSFTDLRIPFWPAHDDERSPAADLFVFVVHDFRMQTFFFLAGFFGCLLYQRHGLRGMLRHRLLRIALPFGLALLLIQPTLQALWLLGDRGALHHVGVAIAPDESRSDLLERQFLTGRFLQSIYPFHLWFLYYLIVFFLLMVPLLGLGRAIRNTCLARAGDRLFRILMTVPGNAFLLAVITALLLWPMDIWGMVDTPNKWQLPPHLIAYYFLFFVLGCLLWRHRDLLPAFTRRWLASLLVANLLVMPILMMLVFDVLDGRKGVSPMPGLGQHLLTCYVSALYTWLMIAGLLGAFQHYFSNERRWVRYFADASYWCYLWHLTPIIALQLALVHAPLPGLVKFVIIIGVSMAILLGSYEWCVRYTGIGALLNGRRYRHTHKAVQYDAK